MKKMLASILLVAIVVMNACQKETSFENGGTSEGTLQSDVSDDCLPKTISGSYVEGTALDGNTNQMLVTANVTKTGTYTVYTDTVNGVYFLSTGVFPTLGSTAVTLKGFGTPLGSGTFNFNVIYEGGDTCSVAVDFLPTGAGGPATFTFEKTGANCSVTNQAGSYTVGTALTSANTVTLSVNVTVIGTYNITTTAGGMTFTGSGGFITTGVQTVVLTGTGTPTTAAANTFTVTQAASTCTFSVTVAPASGAATGTLAGGPTACLPVTLAGTYIAGTALTAANTLQVQVNVATIGTYSITTNTVTGFSFSASGTFATTGNNTVTLVGTGTPTTAGSQNFTVTFGSSTCTFSVTVTPSSGAATGTLSGGPSACLPVTVAGTYLTGTALTAANTVQVQVNVATIGTYSITTNTVTGFSFSASGTFATTGNNTVTLVGTGTPTTAGSQNFTVTFGSSTCTFVIPVAGPPVMDYFPRTTNSNWSYEWGDVSDDSAYRRTNSTISAAGNTYNLFMIKYDPSGFDSSGYYRKSGGSYFERIDMGTFIGYDNPLWVEYVFLKDDQPQGHNWKSAAFSGAFTDPGPPPSTQTLTLRLSYTISQKDVPISIVTSTGTVNYTNVIVVEEKYDLEAAPGVWQDVTSIVGYNKSYYARGIGLIKFEYYDPTGVLDNASKMELRRSQVF